MKTSRGTDAHFVDCHGCLRSLETAEFGNLGEVGKAGNVVHHVAGICGGYCKW